MFTKEDLTAKLTNIRMNLVLAFQNMTNGAAFEAYKNIIETSFHDLEKGVTEIYDNAQAIKNPK